MTQSEAKMPELVFVRKCTVYPSKPIMDVHEEPEEGAHEYHHYCIVTALREENNALRGKGEMYGH